MRHTPLHHPFSRRKFLAGSAAAFAAPMFIPATRLFGADAPSKLVNIAVIGCGGRSAQVVLQNQPYTGVRFVAAVDPFKDRREKFARELNNKYNTDACKPFRDFREIIHRPDIDGVAVFTPDHWHVPVAFAAAGHKKDMYVEKPLGVAMTWAWKLREEIRKSGVVFQYGTQQRSSRVFRQACDLVRNGYIGKIKSVDVWCSSLARKPTKHCARYWCLRISTMSCGPAPHLCAPTSRNGYPTWARGIAMTPLSASSPAGRASARHLPMGAGIWTMAAPSHTKVPA